MRWDVLVCVLVLTSPVWGLEYVIREDEPNSIHTMILLDVNLDGKDDVVMAAQTGKPLSRRLAGEDESIVTLDVGNWPGEPDTLGKGDIDGDGRTDLVVAWLGGGELTWFRNMGESDEWPSNVITTSLHAPLASEQIRERIETGDVTGDGVLDVVFMLEQSVLIFVRNATSSGVWENATIPLVSGDNYRDLELVDMNGDGVLDPTVVYGQVLAYFPIPPGLSPIDVVVADSPLEGFFQFLLKGDLTGDGVTDVLAMSSAKLLLYVGNGTGVAVPAVKSAIPSAFMPLTGGFNPCDLVDLNWDGWPDVVCIAFDRYIVSHINEKDGSFAVPVRLFLSVDTNFPPRQIRGWDLDLDGDMDLALAITSRLALYSSIPSVTLSSTLSLPFSVPLGTEVEGNVTLYTDTGTGYQDSVVNMVDVSVRALGLVNFTLTELRSPGSPTSLVVSFPTQSTALHALFMQISLGVQGSLINFGGTPATVAVTCPPGTVDAITACTGCPANTYRSDTANDCTSCPAGMVSPPSSTEFTQCVCQEGQWLGPPPRVEGVSCFPCPPGSVCPGVTFVPVAAPEFYALNAELGLFTQCASRGCTGNGTCSTGYDASTLACTSCTQGYFADSPVSCARCPSGSTGLLVTLLMGAAFLGVLAGVVVPMVSSRKTLGGGSKASLRRRAFPTSPGLVLMAWQVAGAVARTSIEFPSSASSLLGFFSLFTTPVETVSPLCATTSFAWAYVLSLLPPLLVIGTSVLVAPLVTLTGLVVTGDEVNMGNMVLAVVSAVFPLVFLPLTRSVLVVFSCTTSPSGDSVLSSDPGIPCSGSEYQTALVVGVIVLVLVVVGIPVFLACLLVRVRFSDRELISVHSLIQFGPLIQHFQTRYFWSEFVFIGLRLCATVAVTFFVSTPSIQLLLLALALLATILFVSGSHPYFIPVINTFQTALLACVFVIVLTAFGQHALTPSSASSALTLIALIGLVVVSCGVLVFDLVVLRAQVVDSGLSSSPFVSRTVALNRLVSQLSSDVDEGVAMSGL